MFVSVLNEQFYQVERPVVQQALKQMELQKKTKKKEETSGHALPDHSEWSQDKHSIMGEKIRID